MVDVDGNVPFAYLKTIAKKLNFEVNYLLIEILSNMQMVSDTLASVNQSKTDVTALGLSFSHEVLQLEILLGKVMEISKNVVIVPILQDYTVNVPLAALVYLASFFIITLIYVILFQVFKTKSNEWDFVNVIQILIGVSISQPKKNIDRVIFLTIVILSMIYTDELFSQLTEIKVSLEEKEFSSFRDVYESEIPVYSTYKANRFESEEVKKMFSRSRSIVNFSSCFEEIIRTKNAICVVPFRAATYGVKQNLDSQGKSILRMTHLSLNHKFFGFLYAKASPFLEKFNEMILRMAESAVFPDPELNRVKLHDLEDKLKNETDDTIVKTILAILSIGYILSTTVFISELIIFIT